MSIDWKSKITWIQILSLAVTIVGLLQPAFPQWIAYTTLTINILTVILRQLQGVEVKLGKRTYKI